MAQFDPAERVEEGERELGEITFENTMVEPTDVMTGGRDQGRFLYYQLKMSMKKAERIDIIVSFLMESGVRMLLKDLKAALDRGVKVRMLTGNYLGITQPSALCLIKKELGNRVDLRFYGEKGRSFHPKAYIFHYKDMSEIYIGSSNVSRSALTSGIEWNYRFSSIADKKNFLLFYEAFEDLFFGHSIEIDDEELRRYSKNWHRPAVAKDLARYDTREEDDRVEALFQPRGAQIEALYALEDSRMEGAAKGLVQAATGVGKTYLAAFDSAKYKRVLFVAHREEILKQAAISFRNVRNSEDYGFFYGKKKETDKSVIFASVSTLGREEYLKSEYFVEDYFDYIVIDEFHHAVNEQYKNIVNYFKPKFLLGLTATPERMDGKNIYELCDYNVPYEISLKEAINKGMLVPFHYYGIYDETDYSGLHLVKGHYEEKALTELYRHNPERYELVYKYYTKYRSERALGFCCSRQHAEEMAEQFCVRGIPAAAVYSNAEGAFSEDRDKAVARLKNGEIKVIFSVDMFNEGLDIASLDMVMFLRPTESPIVFLQQLGRGLRTYRGKEYLNVLDFIGNYEKAGRVSLLLGGGSTLSERRFCDSGSIEYPDDCIVDFDMRLIDLFKELERKSLSMKERIVKEYYRVKELMEGKVPTRMELFTYMEDEVYQYCMTHAKENPFRRYLDFLYELGELSAEEGLLYAGMGREFIAVIETTDMQKVYKMPILYSFYNHGDIRLEITDEDVLRSWKEFFDTGTNWKDFSENIFYENYKNMTDKQHLSKAKTMPIRFLKASGKGFFVEKEGYALAIREELREWVENEALKWHMGDVLEYRTMEYYRRRYVERGRREA
ncbi:MAG: DEAD/DEAH box helicase family protein [Candidatus Gastranaerophilales bacterium]|nr:DEAD/DEAH box helicase family protein [Candidatus Gastranaerophilales bacterium]